ncbi:MAG: hypothetical protein ACYTEQ_24200 [Planctomycetota bacterium]|jgi:hypothetical protein
MNRRDLLKAVVAAPVAAGLHSKSPAAGTTDGGPAEDSWQDEAQLAAVLAPQGDAFPNSVCWDVALDIHDIQSLVRGVSPLCIQPERITRVAMGGGDDVRTVYVNRWRGESRLSREM